jgi:hypothetical protein
MLFRRPVLDGIANGSVTLAFRRWKRASVTPGTTLRTAVGLVNVIDIEPEDRGALTPSDARAAGFASLSDLLAELDSGRAGQLFRITLRYGGPDPRVTLRERATVESGDREAVNARLGRFDTASRRGPWTIETLRLIAERPGVRAAELAALAGCETLTFKRDVRKLKDLGLTESLGTGYRLSPRGAAYLAGAG